MKCKYCEKARKLKEMETEIESITDKNKKDKRQMDWLSLYSDWRKVVHHKDCPKASK